MVQIVLVIVNFFNYSRSLFFLRQTFDPLLRSSSKCVGKLNISRVSEKRVTQMKNAGIWTAYDSSQLPTVYLGRVFLRGRKRRQTGGAGSFAAIAFDR